MINREAEHKALDQLLDTLEGKQNFCIIEDRKAPKLYEFIGVEHLDILGLSYHEHYNDEDETWELIIGKEGYAEPYLELLLSRPKYERYEFQIAMGQLLGYDLESCIEFAAQPVDCDCSKCGGPETEEDAIIRKQWVALGKGKIQLGPIEYEGTRPKQAMTYQGRPYGTQYYPDPELLKHSPGIQEWSIPS